MPSQRGFLSRIWRALGRVFPRCGTISQAIAYNVFLAFFPTMLLVVGLASSWIGTRVALMDTIRDFTEFLPPGSQSIVAEFLGRRGPEVWRFALLGWVGTLLVGSQVMKLLMQAIHLIYGDEERMGFLQRQFRGLVLLLITIAPIVGAGILGVFGRPLRHWIARMIGKHSGVGGLWVVFFPLVAMVLAMLALTVIYRVARPAGGGLRQVLPGAMLATLLWWLSNVGFGYYVRRVPYSLLYGGLAATIGLLIWMQISAFIVLLGAAWNAESAGGGQS
ncbi:MAG TPA: YihY/virulence factor BrkB family protein [Candidatus Eisenbacteria bacterium]|nr:YihY/virulence factor BrkB family protein [Candidatus Eisenbacteria bacterium]